MAKLKVAIIGSGLVAAKKHIPAFLKQSARIDVVALCDVDVRVARETAARFGIPNVYGDVAEMFKKESPDLVDICTPPRTHTELAVRAMSSVCHVLIEKPMALTVPDCDEIVNSARQHGANVCVAHSDLFYWPFMKARQAVARGDIGDFCGMRVFLSTPSEYMTSNEQHWAHQLPGGVIGETGPHAVYMTLAFINPIREVSVDALKLLDYKWSRFEDYRINLIGDAGISSITLSYAADQWMARVDILGKDGSLLLDLEGLSFVNYRRPALNPLSVGRSLLNESSQIARNVVSNGVRYFTGRLPSAHDIVVEKFVDSIVHGTEPPVTAEEGREAVRVMQMIVSRLEDTCE